MHGSAGLHSAMAIKRQRRLREQARRRAAERRLSTSRTNSFDCDDSSNEHLAHNHPQPFSYHNARGGAGGSRGAGGGVGGTSAVPDHRLATSIGMLHIGVCFLVFGVFLIGSGLLPDDMVTWRGGGWWNELVATGIFVAALGLFLVCLNRVISRREEEDLEDYVQRQLTRSRSGHRLEQDFETGCLATKNTRRCIEMRRENRERGLYDQRNGGDSVVMITGENSGTTTITTPGNDEQNLNGDVNSTSVGHNLIRVVKGDDCPSYSSLLPPNTPPPPFQQHQPTVLLVQNGDTVHLERIMEEEVVGGGAEQGGEQLRKFIFEEQHRGGGEGGGGGDGTGVEARELVNSGRQYSFNSRQY